MEQDQPSEQAVVREKKDRMGVVVVVTGIALLLLGLSASLMLYIFEPNTFLRSGPLQGSHLELVGMLYLCYAGGILAVVHGARAIRGRPSRPIRLPPFYSFWMLFAIVLGFGNLLLLFPNPAQGFLFPPVFLLGAALPTLAVLGYAFFELGWPLTWRQGSLMLLAGSTLSVLLTLLIGSVVLALGFFFLNPLELLFSGFPPNSNGPGSLLQAIRFSPIILLILLVTAIEAPIQEELAKAVGPIWMGRRIQNERQAFALGLAAGAGFAILENMLYQGVYALQNGWTWGGVTAIRGIGAVMHPLCTGWVVLAWYKEREHLPGWLFRRLKAFLTAVLVHTLWNGGFIVLVVLTGLENSAWLMESTEVFGIPVEYGLLLFLAIFSFVLWQMLIHKVQELGWQAEKTAAAPQMRAGTLAVWAVICILVAVPLGIALGGVWPAIQQTVF
jgi:hypothetical protein